MKSIPELLEMARFEDHLASLCYRRDLRLHDSVIRRRNVLILAIEHHPDNIHSRIAINGQVITGLTTDDRELKDGTHGVSFSEHLDRLAVQAGAKRVAEADVMLSIGPADDLRAFCEAFITEHKISCAETVYQSDRVILNAYEFIEGICNRVGYYHDPEDQE